MLKKISIGLLAAFVVIQFFRPKKNTSNNQANHISTKYNMSDDVNHILQVACNDCHSNQTIYPWYASIQPTAWFLNNHIVEGRQHLNFSEFTNRSIAYQNHKFEEIIDEVNQKEMPLASYTYLGMHKKAKLTDEQRLVLDEWARSQIDTLKLQYPNDSLFKK
jgi:hypothetical protein